MILLTRISLIHSFQIINAIDIYVILLASVSASWCLVSLIISLSLWQLHYYD